MRANREFPIVVAGMHRSGTSMCASLLGAAGIALGDDLLPADHNNPNGYFEDRSFVDFHCKVLPEICQGGADGHLPWGWTENEVFETAVLSANRLEAIELVKRRSRQSVSWAFNDPRATLVLDFWDQLLPNARYLLVYRFPWGVADSMQRIGAPVFLENPDYAYRIWNFYNQKLLEFYQQHRERCLLLSSDALLDSNAKVVEPFRSRLGVELTQQDLRDQLDPSWFRRFSADDPIISLVHKAFPRSIKLLQELDDAADLGSAGMWQLDDVSAISAKLAPAAGKKFAVIIPTYNDAEFLIESVASVARNAPPDSELVVVNDGSTAEFTLSFLEILKANGFCVIDKENGGVSTARNLGIEQSSAPYILTLDADNLLAPDFLERSEQIFEGNNEIGVVYGDVLEFGMRRGIRRPAEFDLARLLWGNYIDNCAVFRRQLWTDVGGYDPALDTREDWEFWIYAGLKRWRFYRLEQGFITFSYRVRPDSKLHETSDDANQSAVVRYVFSKHRAEYLERFGEIINQSWRHSEELHAQLNLLENQVQELRRISAAQQAHIEHIERSKAWRIRQWVGNKKAKARRATKSLRLWL